MAISLTRRNLRLASGLVLFTYIAAHLFNHALGLVSLDAAETGLRIAVTAWQSRPGTALLYGAAATHFLLALWAVYERRTFRLPPAELLRIVLGFTLPILLIGHAAATRLAYELFGLPSNYARVVADLWMSDSQGRQLALLAPGWLHGCLGLHFAFNRRPLYRHLRFALFGAALLLPALSALGFVAMGRELAASTAAAAAVDYSGTAHAARRIAIAQWRDGLLAGYFALIGATFAARAIRNVIERSRKRLIAISYPTRIVRMPRGSTVLEASRSFHIPHASMCGGRARCSTCRVRVTAGADVCPPAAADERATLDRIGAPPDVRLACQLRPQGDISLIPLVRTERADYRAAAPQRGAEREIVVLFCDFLNRADLARDHLPQDLLYVLTLYVEAVETTIRAAGGTLSYIQADSICALFGLDAGLGQAARQALQAAGAIDQVLADLNDRLGRQWDCRAKIAVSIHAGRAVVGEVGASEPPVVMAVGQLMDVANELRKSAAAHGKPFAISQPVYAAAGVAPALDETTALGSSGSAARIRVRMSASPPARPAAPALPGNRSWRTAWRRLRTG
jgi:adenylate cyclase